MTTIELISYYANLLIFQYLGKSKAYATIEALVNGPIMPQTSIQEITFSSAPTSGSFVLSYNGNNTTSINYNDSITTIQSELQSLTGLSQVTVSGTIESLNLIVTFTGVNPPALLLIVESNTLSNTNGNIDISILETDVTLPIAVQNSFNLIGEIPAQGVQLDVLAKYAGVVRNGVGLTGQPIVLDDTDFLTFIKMAIVKNSSGSSLSDITNLIFQFFVTDIVVVDLANMNLTYMISTSVSSNLLEIFISENLLPAPMGVNISVIIYAPVVNAFFGFVTYDNPDQPMITRPFNNYDDYNTNWVWFSYSDVLTI